jgi:1-acyl-sn-glycerol-3-phosphate acyltransferase
VVVDILDPIPPGLDKKVFIARLQDEIETATARLVAEAQAKQAV